MKVYIGSKKSTSQTERKFQGESRRVFVYSLHIGESKIHLFTCTIQATPIVSCLSIPTERNR